MTDQLLQNHLDILDLRKQSAKKTSGLSPIGINALTAATGTLYAGRPRLYDVAKNYTPHVDWDGVIANDPLFAGAYLKAFEPYDDTPNGDAACDNWFVDGWETDLNTLYQRKKLHGPYFFSNPARKSILQSLEWYKSLDNGTPADQFSKWLNADPHIWGLCKIWKVGFSKILHPTIDDVIQMPSNDFDFVVEDDERLWKQYGIKPWNTQGNIIADVVLGEVWQRTPARIQKCMDWGIFPKRPILKYSAQWVLDYMHDQQAVFENWDSICAHYFWSGNTVVTTLPGMVETMKEIPDAWRPNLFGRPKMFQISGDHFKVPQFTTNTGGLSAIDLNVFWDGWAGMKTYFPTSNLGEPGAIVPPPPPPPPPPAPVITYFALVRQTATGLKLRIGASTLATILDADFRPLAKIKLMGKPVKIGTITWATMDWDNLQASFATEDGDRIFADVTEVTV